jgi:diguanylate cyclase (GGDEF)-like protein/PAS domain S-box-containing protein
MPIISDLMTFHADRVPLNATLGQAASLMVEAGISSVIVVDENQVVGIVTERDVLHAMRQHEGISVPVRQVMTSPVHTVVATQDFRDAYREAARLGIRHLVVVDAKNRPIGVVTETDFRRHMGLGFFRQMNNVAALMDTKFPQLSPTDSLQSALTIMERNRASCVVVVEANRPQGIVTERDVVRLFLTNAGETQLVGLMTSPVKTVHQDLPLAEAARLMQEHRFRHLLVVDDAGEVAGVLNEHCLMRLLELDLVDEAVEDRIAAAAASEARLKMELDLAQALAVGKSREVVISTILDVALRFPEFDRGGIYWRDREGGYQIILHRGLTAEALMEIEYFPPASPQAKMIDEGRVLLRACGTHLRCDSLTNCLGKTLCHDGKNALLVLPVKIAGVVQATVVLTGYESRQVSNETVFAMQALSSQFSATLERLAAQEETNQLRDNLSGLFESLNDIILAVNHDGIIVHHNGALTSQLGYDSSELLGKSVMGLQEACEQEHAAACFKQVLSGERSTSQMPFVRRDGSLLKVERRMISGHWDGQPVVFCVAQDISERLISEERQSLAASVFDNAHEGIVVTDPEGIIVEVNATFSELTGYAREEAVGKRSDLLKSGHHNAEFYQDMWKTIADTGFWRGEIWNRKKNGEIIVEILTISAVKTKSGELTHYVGIFSDITPLKEHQQRLEQLAHFDALTQLPNRMLLSDRLQHAMAQAERSKQLLAICYLDLDGFKPVNDQYGHSVGDRLLVEVAQRLRQCVRAGDTAARLGGDEFVLIFSSLTSANECERAVTRVLNTLSTPIHISGHNLQLSASIGVTLFPHDGADADTLLRHADQAMYQAKQAGRNRYHMFDLETDRRTRTRRVELQRFGEAIEHDEFLLYYQPKVNMREGRVLGAEALIRWQHPEQGLLPPAAFLPSIEGTEMDIRIGEWVLKTAVNQLNEWRKQGLETCVSVNISGPHLQMPGFVDYLIGVLKQFPDVPPACLELEILETAALEDIAKVAGVFDACRKLGVNFALDDFGTGYSSLTYFRRLPADVLKIDQSFVRSMLDDSDDLAIVEGVIGLTKAFERKVIAEGVETPEHGMVLLNLGCDLAQGYGVARPMPADRFPDWVSNFTSHPLWNSITSFRWAKEDLPLLLAEFEHRRWMEVLKECMSRDNSSEMLLELNPRECRFGRWFFSEKAQKRYRYIEQFPLIEGIHDRIHTLAKDMLVAKSEEDQVLIEMLEAELARASVSLADVLQAVQAEILLVGHQPRRA